MSGDAIDASVTLDEVLAVVGSKRVPLAPELAGYLVLEIAEHADPAGGDIDAKSVFVGEEDRTTAARFRLRNPDEVVTLLRRLVVLLRAGTTGQAGRTGG